MVLKLLSLRTVREKIILISKKFVGEIFFIDCDEADKELSNQSLSINIVKF